MATKNNKDGHRVYTFTVEYNKNTAEIINISEEYRETNSGPCFSYGELYLEDYWDDDAISIMDQMNDIGVT